MELRYGAGSSFHKGVFGVKQQQLCRLLGCKEKNMQPLGVVWLDVEAFFISPGASSPMRVE